MSAETNGAMPATAFNENDHDGYYTTHYGLTKRELFAAMAMQGLLARYGDDDYQAAAIAKWSVEKADALLEELAKGERNGR